MGVVWGCCIFNRRQNMEDSLDFDYVFKYILVGDTSVGKSSLLSAYKNRTFSDSSNPTMGVEFATKKVSIGGIAIKLQIWDTAGQESFRTITRAYYKNAIGVILVYDLTSPATIEALQSWVAEIEENSNEKIEIIIVGNKKDIYKGDEVTLPPSISKFKHYNSSAKTGHNLDKIFSELTTTVLQKLKNKDIEADGAHGVKRGNSGKGAILKWEQPIDEQTPSRCC